MVACLRRTDPKTVTLAGNVNFRTSPSGKRIFSPLKKLIKAIKINLLTLMFQTCMTSRSFPCNYKEWGSQYFRWISRVKKGLKHFWVNSSFKTIVNAMQRENMKSDNLFQIPLYTIWLCRPSSMVISSPTSLKPFSGMLLTLIISLVSMTWTATSLPPLTSHLSTTHWCPPLCKCATLKSQLLRNKWNSKV